MGQLKEIKKTQKDKVENYRRKHRPMKRLKKQEQVLQEQVLQDGKRRIEGFKNLQRF